MKVLSSPSALTMAMLVDSYATDAMGSAAITTGETSLEVAQQPGSTQSEGLNMKRSAFTAFTAVILSGSLAMATPVAAGIIPISSEVSLEALAVIIIIDPVEVRDTDSQSQGADLNPLRASVSAVAEITGFDASVEALETVEATWDSAFSGKVLFSDVGRITKNNVGPFPGVGSLTSTQRGVDWQYIFEATEEGRFELDYVITTDALTDFPAGLPGFNFTWLTDGASLPGGAEFIPFDARLGIATGTVTREIMAGTTYTVRLRDQANLLGGVSQGTSTALMDAEFNWRAESDSTPTIPEPSSLALLCFGLAGLAGIAYRQHRIKKAGYRDLKAKTDPTKIDSDDNLPLGKFSYAVTAAAR